MNIYGIKQGLCALEQIGHTLDSPQRMKIQMSLLKLTEIANADQLLFWGKIFTNGDPYYIAMSVDFKGYYAFPHKKFYYSTTKFNFEELPALDEFNKQKVQNFNNQPFTGDPNTILINIQGQQGQENKEPPPAEQAANVDSDDQEQKNKIVPKNLTQVDRLGYTVRAIENQCQVVPIGAFKMTQSHEIRYNQSFRGLTLKNYTQFQHFRYPITQKSIDKLQSADSVLCLDFLEPIDNQSYWSVQLNTMKDLVTIRNLLWNGYLGFHRLGTKENGGIYFGNGIKKVDMPFCL